MVIVKELSSSQVCPTELPAPGVLTSGTDLTPNASDDNPPPQECELSSLKWQFLFLYRNFDPIRINVGPNVCQLFGSLFMMH